MTYQQIAIRLILAFLMGGLIGLERERNSRPAGFRTNILVSVGSALIMIVSIKLFLSFPDSAGQIDPGRIAAQVVSGIGFLGAGTIIREQFSVKGLTTAASMWALAGIGLALGAGFYVSGILVTAMVIITLTILNRLEDNFYKKNLNWKINIKVFDQPGFLSKIGEKFNENRISIKNVGIKPCYEEAEVIIELEVKTFKDVERNELITHLAQLEEVSELEIEAID
ncbi:MgtC/SapB family protein [Halanaerobacter jeridensis]|uniref:Mg2+ transporter-C (MgtC) family protein n=1 Tax=Halanaerobacter jeridensis TaxID=706427 RepID=A0A939BNF2_9FIRM|nr:MgtC/SapB family protein [Halanaerobacter jeridensis]MBM7555382.1 putative Mg2+ transporter-C (MgtC) family protein [Halanaerobacter jeridensis]